ncbi:MAG: helix-turn-helix transcriptional regulator [Aerococcus suis]|nr:helix-turn-helix transcriptional regulator [Aerococcus suis]
MFGERLKYFRKSQGMTQKELAKSLNVSQPTIGSWEVGRTEPSQEMQRKIARIFDISLNTLLGDDSEDKYDLRMLLKTQSMTYNGEEISEHDLTVLQGIVDSLLGGGGDDK